MLDPKDYPFNYIVHEGNDQFPFAKYPDAEAFVRANFPELIFDEHWSNDSDARYYCDTSENVKVIWKPESLAEFDRMNIDEEEWPEGRDLIVERHGIMESQVWIERRRDAYESAQMEAYLTEGRLDTTDEGSYEEEEFDEEEE